MIAIADLAAAVVDDSSTMPFSYPRTDIATLQQPRASVEYRSLRPSALNAHVAVAGIENARATSRRVGLLALIGRAR